MNSKMIDDTNPAGRLHRILSDARKHSDQTKIRDVWAKTLDCDPKDDAEISARVVEVYNLAREVERLIKLIPDLNHDLYLHSFENINKAIFPLNLASLWRDKKNALSADIMTRLQFCANELESHYSEESIAEESLREIDELAAELFESVLGSDIEVSLRMALLEELAGIRSALATYRIKGARGVKQALQSLLGMAIAQRESLAEIPSDKKSLLQRVGTLIDKLDSFTSAATKTKRILSGTVVKALAFLSNGIGG